MDRVEAISRYLASFGRKPDSDVLAAYALVLHDLSDEKLSMALNIVIRQNREHPMSAGQLRNLAELGGMSVEDRAELAWCVLEETLRHHGYDRTLAFEDAALTATVRALGGLERLCRIPDEDFHNWTKRSFVRTYCTYVRNPPAPEACLPLMGWFDRENIRLGWNDHQQDPLLIESNLPALPNAPDVRKLITRPDHTRRLLRDVRSEAKTRTNSPATTSRVTAKTTDN